MLKKQTVKRNFLKKKVGNPLGCGRIIARKNIDDYSLYVFSIDDKQP